MAILITMADNSEQHFDTIEEFEQALIFTKRLNGEKVPQDLLDEVREKYDGKDPKTSQVEIDGPQDLEALSKAVEAFFKGIDVTEEDVNMENLPIGTVVKVVDNTTGHCHDLCEILPITDVEYDGKTLYHLDNKIEGWVAVKDIEFVSFPEEEESTSGDEGLAVDEDGSEIKAGDTVVATEDEFDITEGVEYEIKEFESGALYFLDDDGDIRHVSDHEERLRKKTDKRGFKQGDIVYVNEEITDNFGDTISSGIVTEFMEALIDRGVRNPNGINVRVGEDDLDKLTLVCRAEDRLDK